MSDPQPGSHLEKMDFGYRIQVEQGLTMDLLELLGHGGIIGGNGGFSTNRIDVSWCTHEELNLKPADP